MDIEKNCSAIEDKSLSVFSLSIFVFAAICSQTAESLDDAERFFCSA
jgi:hypothetical protein